MKTINFQLAGNRYFKIHATIFIESKNRIIGKKVFNHNNDFTTSIELPKDIFKNNFKFDRSSGIYRTKLRYIDILPWINVTFNTNGDEHRVIGYYTNTLEGHSLNYGVIETVQNINLTVNPIIQGQLLNDDIKVCHNVTTKNVIYGLSNCYDWNEYSKLFK